MRVLRGWPVVALFFAVGAAAAAAARVELTQRIRSPRELALEAVRIATDSILVAVEWTPPTTGAQWIMGYDARVERPDSAGFALERALPPVPVDTLWLPLSDHDVSYTYCVAARPERPSIRVDAACGTFLAPAVERIGPPGIPQFAPLTGGGGAPPDPPEPPPAMSDGAVPDSITIIPAELELAAPGDSAVMYAVLWVGLQPRVCDISDSGARGWAVAVLAGGLVTGRGAVTPDPQCVINWEAMDLDAVVSSPRQVSRAVISGAAAPGPAAGALDYDQQSAHFGASLFPEDGLPRTPGSGKRSYRYALERATEPGIYIPVAREPFSNERPAVLAARAAAKTARAESWRVVRHDPAGELPPVVVFAAEWSTEAGRVLGREMHRMAENPETQSANAGPRVA